MYVPFTVGAAKVTVVPEVCCESVAGPVWVTVQVVAGVLLQLTVGLPLV
ncbi:MAG: hypothetical protein J0I77_09160 [Rudaea sp.]|nr:hypothetical protein [Rudaea sp.]MBR0345697.1 hypothetical protein [Rudaea sp.]